MSPPQAPTYNPYGTSLLSPLCWQCPSFRCLARFVSCSSSPVWHSCGRHRLHGQTAEAVSHRLPQRKHHNLLALLSPPSWGCTRSLCCPTQSLLQQEGSHLCIQPFLRASGSGAAGSRAAGALLMSLACSVSSLTQGWDGMEEGYQTLPPCFSPWGWVGQFAHPLC